MTRHVHRLKKIIGGVLLLTTVACRGPAGQDGAPGPAGPGLKRGADYCNEVTGTVKPSASQLSAYCNAAADIPIEGWCYEPSGLPTDARLVQEFAVAWDTTTTPAGWTCGWTWTDLTPISFTGAADICCAKPQ